MTVPTPRLVGRSAPMSKRRGSGVGAPIRMAFVDVFLTSNLTAMFAFLASGDWRELVDETGLPLKDRVAVALRCV